MNNPYQVAPNERYIDEVKMTEIPASERYIDEIKMTDPDSI
jgi:hypothetical protein